MKLIESIENNYRIFKDESGLLHKTDGPAKIGMPLSTREGDELWYFNGKEHRIGGVQAKWIGPYWQKTSDGWYKFQWCRHGNVHRLNAPAQIKYDGFVRYFEFGILIRSAKF